MDAMIATILVSLAPVFLVMALGYLAGLTRAVDNRNIGSLNALVMDFALPAALFTAMAQASRAEMIGQARLALVLLLAMLLVFALAYAAQVHLFGRGRQESALLALTASGPNVGSAGLPIVAVLFDKSVTISVAIAVAVTAIVVTPLTLLILEAEQGERRGVAAVMRSALVQPIVIAPVIGLSCSLADLSLPLLVDTTLTLVGQGASGAALFLTGLVLSAQPIRLAPDAGLATVLKNLMQPALAALLAWPLLDSMEARVAVVLTAVPSGAFGVLFAVRYHVKSAEIGTTLILSTLTSVVTLTGAILVTGGWQH
jgi:malonate transporter and related proteins